MSERRAAGLVDTHCHLNHPRLLRRLPEMLARAHQAGVSDMIVVGYDLPSSRLAVELAAQHEGLWAAVGIHPHDAGAVTDSDFVEIRALARADKVVAIGETGLDFYRDLSPRPAQMESFERHLDLAFELRLPAVIHCREAQDSVLEVVSSRQQARLVWHCFDASLEQLERAVGLGLVLGFGGRLTHRAAGELRDLAKQAPADRILLETDAPYLSPEPGRSRDNEPANVALIAEALAAARGKTMAAIAEVTSENARRVFGLGGNAA
jgi:TatD DNase family protein